MTRIVDNPVDLRLRLTEERVAWIARNLDSSIVARVALRGYGEQWPDYYVTAAIKACNDKGSEFYGSATEGNEDGSNRDVPPFDNDPRTDEEIKQAVYDAADRGEWES